MSCTHVCTGTRMQVRTWRDGWTQQKVIFPKLNSSHARMAAHTDGLTRQKVISPKLNSSSVIYTHSSMSTRMHAHTLTHTYTNEVEICPLGLQHTIPCALICAHTKVMSPTSPLPILLFPHPFCQYRPGHVFQDPIM